MKKFVIERNFPGAGNLTKEKLQEISQVSCEVIKQLDKIYYWLHSYVCYDKIYCVHIPETEEVLREHARLCKFPINTISKIKAIIDPLTSNPLT